MKLDHTGLNVTDLPAAQAWYSAAFRLREEFAFHFADVAMSGVVLVHDDGWRIELIHRAGSDGGIRATHPIEAALTLGYSHFAVAVDEFDDVDRTYRDLLAAGAADRMSPRPAPEPGARMAFVADPEGNLIEILCRRGTS